MKKAFLSLIVIFYLQNSFAQVSYYKGEWTQINHETIFSGLLKIDIKDSLVTGEIIWMFAAIDSANNDLVKYYKDQKGKMGVEYVKGKYSPQTRDIQFEGISKTDPDLIIGMDKYLLKLSANSLVIYGRTLSNGDNNGLVYFYKADNMVGEKQFNMLKSKILSNSGNKAFR